MLRHALSLLGLALVAAKPQIASELKLSDGRIIGGEEAPKRKSYDQGPFFGLSNWKAAGSGQPDGDTSTTSKGQW